MGEVRSLKDPGVGGHGRGRGVVDVSEEAALTIADGLKADQKKYLLAKDVGHYGIFNGSKWRTKIAPVVEDWIAAHEG